MTENQKTLALGLLNGFYEQISAQLVLLRYCHDGSWSPYHKWERGARGFTGLYSAALIGIGVPNGDGGIGC